MQFHEFDHVVMWFQQFYRRQSSMLYYLMAHGLRCGWVGSPTPNCFKFQSNPGVFTNVLSWIDETNCNSETVCGVSMALNNSFL